MEEMNARMAEQVEAVTRQLEAVTRRNKDLEAKLDGINAGSSAPAAGAMDSDDDDDDLGQPDDIRTDDLEAIPRPPRRTRSGGAAADAADETDDDEGQPGDIRTDDREASTGLRPTRSFHEHGFRWHTGDEEFELQFHNETQLDFRAYEQANSSPVDQVGFYINRMRLYFNGRLTKPIEYSVSVNKGLADLDLLDAYLNFNYDRRFQLRVGRYRVPFTYDWYALSNQFLPTPERSIFALNYGYNRNFAFMGHGELFDDRVDYAVAAANGPRNSYYDDNSHKDVLAYVNYRPFERSERLKALKHLNVGGSMAYGIQDQDPFPRFFRTYTSTSNSPGQFKAGPTFLELNDDVLERGGRKLWELHAAYYYKGLTLMGAWDSGLNTYGVEEGGRARSVALPTSGYHAQFAYLLTGEEVERRYFITPLRPFDLRKGKFGLGAFEIQARYDHFQVGDEVFTGGLADPNLWTNRVSTVDFGVNWYLNKYTKIYFDWQHTMYGQPVPYRPGGFQSTSDLFWMRFQIYF
ncbi:MAG: hypothetical protein BGO49_29060 [Planctomycetales bacterium 71-10]|nr:MAG: hypothetical protein BGO49_29060 [Planctomycetales bacterium 71-10]